MRKQTGNCLQRLELHKACFDNGYFNRRNCTIYKRQFYDGTREIKVSRAIFKKEFVSKSKLNIQDSDCFKMQTRWNLKVVCFIVIVNFGGIHGNPVAVNRGETK